MLLRSSSGGVGDSAAALLAKCEIALGIDALPKLFEPFL